jgi:general secretion pathway protein K
MKTRSLRRQRGVAVITALLLTTLAITIVASLFWQQQVQVRSIENQRLQLQKQWILRGAIDYARVILTADTSLNIDSLDDPWAVPLAETRLDDYVENGRADTDVPDAVLSGGIEDAYARFNLIKLVKGGQPDAEQVAAFGRLLTSLQLSPGLALPTATAIAATLKPPATPDSKGGNPGGGSTSQSTSTNTAPQFMEFRQVDDLLAVPGFTPEILEALRKYVIVLPLDASTKVNVNTASAEVLSATFPNLSVAEANALVAARKGRAFTSIGDQTLVSLLKNSADIGGKIQVNSDYFLVYGKVRLNRAGMEMQTLVKRNTNRTAQVIWIREF